MKTQIRKATLEDVDRLIKLVHDCISAMRAMGIDQWDDVYPDRRTVERDVAAGTLEVLYDSQGILACITLDQSMDPMWQGLDWTADSEPAVAVHRLMVDPAVQGRGCARLLMAHAEEGARRQGFRSIRLDCFLQNPRAMSFYSSLGYRRTGTAMMRKGAFAGFEKLL